MGERGQQQKNS